MQWEELDQQLMDKSHQTYVQAQVHPYIQSKWRQGHFTGIHIPRVDKWELPHSAKNNKKRNSACLQHRLEISHCPHRNLFAEMEWLIDWTIMVCRKPCFVFYPCLKRPVRISSLGFLEEEWEIQLVHLYQESYQGWCVYNMMNASLFNSLLLHL